MTSPHATTPRDWRDLTQITQGAPLVVERVRLADTGIAIEGAFALPQLAQLTQEDQVFVAAFVRSHGSIKEMERLFGVSYPTVKSRLERVGKALTFVDTSQVVSRADVLGRLQRNEITPDEAVSMLEGLR